MGKKSDNPHVSENIKIKTQHSYVLALVAFLISFLNSMTNCPRTHTISQG